MNLKNQQELRRKRAELSVALRKQARDEQLLKRRAMSPETETPVETEKVMTPEEILEGIFSYYIFAVMSLDWQMTNTSACCCEATTNIYKYLLML